MNKSKALPILIILIAPILGCGTPASTVTVDPTSVPVVSVVEPTASPPTPTKTDSSSRSSVLSQLSGTGEVNRSVLTYAELMGGFEFDSPMNEAAFAIPDEAAPPNHVFEGRLELFGEDINGEMQVLRGELGPASAHLPEFDFEFVQSGTYLIPSANPDKIAGNVVKLTACENQSLYVP